MNLGVELGKLGELEDAATAYRQCIELEKRGWRGVPRAGAGGGASAADDARLALGVIYGVQVGQAQSEFERELRLLELE